MTRPKINDKVQTWFDPDTGDDAGRTIVGTVLSVGTTAYVVKFETGHVKQVCFDDLRVEPAN